MLYTNVVGTQFCLVTTYSAWYPTEFVDHLPFLSPKSVWVLCTIRGTDHLHFLAPNSFQWLFTVSSFLSVWWPYTVLGTELIWVTVYISWQFTPPFLKEKQSEHTACSYHVFMALLYTVYLVIICAARFSLVIHITYVQEKYL
jgi:hypothetical protein